jgi:hypothetical protein
MTNKVLIKKSSVPSKVPQPNDLEFGELAINYADGKLYYKNASNNIESFEQTLFITNLSVHLRDTTEVIVDIINGVLNVYARTSVVDVSIGVSA